MHNWSIVAIRGSSIEVVVAKLAKTPEPAFSGAALLRRITVRTLSSGITALVLRVFRDTKCVNLHHIKFKFENIL